MCGRYVRRATKNAIADWFGVDPEHLPEFGPSFNIAPQTFQPVVRLSPESGEREIVLMRWGLVPFWARDTRDGVKRINARAESIVTTASFREAIKKRRCLVPADAFYEWQKIGAKSKQAFAIGMLDGSQYGFAGLWESWKEENGTLLETFTIITTDPNEVMEPLHDRMPVIIEPKDYDRWLQPAEAQALPLDLLRPFPAKRMRAWKASSRVGNVRNDEESLLVCDDAPTLWD
jgi:putative SOS response-associated peptidase YedK